MGDAKYRPKTKQSQSSSSLYLGQQGRKKIRPKSAQDIKEAIIKEIIRLGEKFKILRDYDVNEHARRAIVNYNLKNIDNMITDDDIDYILKSVNAKILPEGAEYLKSLHNSESRRKGLSHLLGPKGYTIVSRDNDVLGTIMAMAIHIHGFTKANA